MWETCARVVAGLFIRLSTAERTGARLRMYDAIPARCMVCELVVEPPLTGRSMATPRKAADPHTQLAYFVVTTSRYHRAQEAQHGYAADGAASLESSVAGGVRTIPDRALPRIQWVIAPTPFMELAMRRRFRRRETERHWFPSALVHPHPPSVGDAAHDILQLQRSVCDSRNVISLLF